MALRLVPVTLAEANAFVAQWHRHHAPVVGHKFSVGVEAETLVGVVIVGRPISRHLDTGMTLEINRLCCDGTPNAPSFLLGAARRAAWALGYRRLITYTLPSEGGASLRAAGYRCVGEAGGGSWSRPSRARISTHPLEKKWLWEAAD